ncbi:sigma 54-interacting transcriptional regulator [Massilia sp. CCM 9210]|uniref:sigma 54-interacting transcriptional regulator n=1 Tax=Massilia scottii TaxID=3057166 RepID=UPI00279661A0|nr:sigma 54-interacting transcriptional regulator [Massilia sp. CCM 9210]MDQ1816829.1 sigma 54-interacting transcriptional regulator [Massilia sp. CCM 9210]
MNDVDNTLTTQLFSQKNGITSALLGLTILWHPETERIGEQFIGPAEEGAIEVCRYAPLFFRPGQDGIALGHRAIARAPLMVRRTADDGVELAAPDSRMALEVNGTLLSGTRSFTREEVGAGVVLGLGGHVLLCLHWMTSFPRPNLFPGLLGVSSGAIATRELIRQVAGTDLAVLLLGETGTGKDVAARAIHQASKRSANPLVAVNMATLSESLAAADLFGAAKGAYTGAQAPRQGLFAEADGGTLFLDELGDTPASVQPMLLRVLETGCYRPLGASQDARTTARLIAATDQDLDARGFNQPLLRRMEAFVIRVPTLRERREDIGVLLLHMLKGCGLKAEELAAFPPALVSEMCNYDWPGNIRQLANVARRMVMALQAGERPLLSQYVQAPAPLRSASASLAAPNGQPNGQPHEQPRSASLKAPLDTAPRRKLAEVSNDDLLGALEEHGWQISGAAQQLGLSRPSLYKLIEAHPAIRPAALIPRDELDAALRAHGGDLALCASLLKTPSEALRRHLRVLGLDAGTS